MMCYLTLECSFKDRAKSNRPKINPMVRTQTDVRFQKLNRELEIDKTV